MPNPAAKYADEFRRETADHIISTGRPITECCAELGLNSKTVNKWVQNRRRELAGGPDPKAEDRELREAVRRVWPEPDRRFGFRFVKRFLPGEFSGLTLYRARKLMREPGMRGCTPNARKRATIPDPKAKPRPDLVRRDFTGPVPACKLVGDIAYLRTGEGVAAPLDGHRPGHPHGGGLVALRANDGGHRGIGADVGQIARLRGGKRDIPRRPRRPALQQAFGRVGARQRRAPVLQPLRRLPRQRGGGIVLRDAEEHCAAEKTADEPFFVLLGDVIVPDNNICPRMLEVSRAHDGASVIAVLPVPDEQVHRFGIIGGAPVEGEEGVWKVNSLVEKPALEDAPSNLSVFGRYLLSARVMELLADAKPTVGGEIQLTDALDAVLAEEEMYAVVISDEDGFDTGTVETRLDTNNKLYARKNG